MVDSSHLFPSNPLFHEALQEIGRERGYEHAFLDEGPYMRLLIQSYFHKAAYRILGRRPLTYWAFNRALMAQTLRFKPDLILIVKGAYVSPRALQKIKEKSNAVLINYATDDPFNPKMNTPALVRSIPLYDLYVSTKRAIMQDIQRAGCPNVAYVPFAYKPSVHFPEKPQTDDERHRFASDIVFIGGCDADRAPLFRTFIEALPEVRLALYGGRWKWHRGFGAHYRGVVTGRDFRMALGGAKIALNIVRRSNRDGHVMRSFEVPACGAFMLAERTDEHLELFEENKDAAYFSSPEELVEKSSYYLRHDSERERIAANGHKTVTNGKHTYKERLARILKSAGLPD